LLVSFELEPTELFNEGLEAWERQS
jgi:hypothetical protein